MSNIPIVKVIGIIFAVVGLYFAVQSTSGFIENCNQKDWTVETATVVNVEKRIESIGIKSTTHKLVYDVFYEYTVDGKAYSGTIYGTVDYSKKIGSTFEIKYNPKSPGESTHILSPSVSNLIFGIACTLLFIIFSLIMTGVINIKRVSDAFNRKRGINN